jgi:hypothetical protein
MVRRRQGDRRPVLSAGPRGILTFDAWLDQQAG